MNGYSLAHYPVVAWETELVGNATLDVDGTLRDQGALNVRRFSPLQPRERELVRSDVLSKRHAPSDAPSRSEFHVVEVDDEFSRLLHADWTCLSYTMQRVVSVQPRHRQADGALFSKQRSQELVESSVHHCLYVAVPLGIDVDSSGDRLPGELLLDAIHVGGQRTLVFRPRGLDA